MTTFFVNWQDQESRRWHTVGKMVHSDDFFFFFYTKGASASNNFVPFGNMSNVEAVYISTELFPIIANRVVGTKRPEFGRYAEWSGLSSFNKQDPLLVMARMGGGRATDNLQVYPAPEKTNDGRYSTVFFVHGIRYLDEVVQKSILKISSGDVLYPMLDIHNIHDKNAVSLRTNDPSFMVGYCPRYLARDVATLAKENDNFKIFVKKVNESAPYQFKLLCEVACTWPRNFDPCQGGEYEPITPMDINVLKNMATNHGQNLKSMP